MTTMILLSRTSLASSADIRCSAIAASGLMRPLPSLVSCVGDSVPRISYSSNRDAHDQLPNAPAPTDRQAPREQPDRSTFEQHTTMSPARRIRKSISAASAPGISGGSSIFLGAIIRTTLKYPAQATSPDAGYA